ncbi:MAG: hypothetical protein WDO70_07965 [Alphaproteobacteria bacterium]
MQQFRQGMLDALIIHHRIRLARATLEDHVARGEHLREGGSRSGFTPSLADSGAVMLAYPSPRGEGGAGAASATAASLSKTGRKLGIATATPGKLDTAGRRT